MGTVVLCSGLRAGRPRPDAGPCGTSPYSSQSQSSLNNVGVIFSAFLGTLGVVGGADSVRKLSCSTSSWGQAQSSVSAEFCDRGSQDLVWLGCERFGR